jgi:hypothetical protein
MAARLGGQVGCLRFKLNLELARLRAQIGEGYVVPAQACRTSSRTALTSGQLRAYQSSRRPSRLS